MTKIEALNRLSFHVRSFDGAILAAEAILPPSPRAVIVYSHGSFLQDRFGDYDNTKTWMFPDPLPKRKLFLDVATKLLDQGVISVLYDKRASGESEGTYHQIDMTVLAKDLQAVIKESRKIFKSRPVGALGHSEGGLTVLHALQLLERPDFLLFTAPWFTPLTQTLQHQFITFAQAFLLEPGKQRNVYHLSPYMTALYQAAKSGELLKSVYQDNDSVKTIRLGRHSFLTNLEKYRQYESVDPSILLKFDGQITVLQGDKDQNIPLMGLEKVEEQFKNSCKSNFKAVILKDHDHSFRNGSQFRDTLESYRLPISEAFLEAISSETSSMLCKTEKQRIQSPKNSLTLRHATDADKLFLLSLFVYQMKAFDECPGPSDMFSDNFDISSMKEKNIEFLIAEDGGMRIGAVWHTLRERPKIADFYVSISEPYRGKAYIVTIMQNYFRYVFEELSFRRVETGILSKNFRSLRAARKVALEECGVQARAVPVGQGFEDLVLFSLNKDSFSAEF